MKIYDMPKIIRAAQEQCFDALIEAISEETKMNELREMTIDEFVKEYQFIYCAWRP